MPARKNILRGTVWAGLLEQRLAAVPGTTANWMEQHTRLLKSDAHSRVGLLRLQQQWCCLKFYLAKSPLQRLGFRLGYGRGLRAFDRADDLAGRGLRVPRALACLLVPEGMLLLTEGIAASRDLRALWQQRPGAQQAPGWMYAAGEALAALHCAGFAHGDCKWSNLLWRDGSIYLVDLEGVREVAAHRPGDPSLHPRQLRDLARFTVDAEELGVGKPVFELFLASYCDCSGSDRDRLVGAMQAPLQIIRNRHRARYGTAGDTLV